nr:immunoglobulin light chain junction region [Homo sapiens]
ATYYCQQSYST